MIENYQKPKNRRLRYSPWLAVVLIIIISTQLICCTGSKETEGTTPSPTVPAEPLQLGKLQTHTYDGMGFAVSYPSNWVELQKDASIQLISLSLCMNEPLAIGVFSPVDTSSVDLQFAINQLISRFIEETGYTIVSNEPITANGIPMVQVVTSDTSSFSFEIWLIFLFISSHDGTMLGNVIAQCRTDCWEYYKDAVYTITSTYQFLD